MELTRGLYFTDLLLNMSGTTDVFVRYGVFVSTKSLLTTSLAYPKLVDPLRALALIRWRRRRGIFRSSSLAIEAVPEEVWELVHNALVKIEQDDAEYEFVMDLLCDDCHSESVDYMPTKTWPDLWDTECHWCAERRWAYEGLSQEQTKSQASLEEVRIPVHSEANKSTPTQASMLTQYGLEQPSDKCYPASRADDSVPFLTESPDSGILVSIPPAGSPSRRDADVRSATATITFDEPGSDHRRDAVADVSLQLLDDADERFRRFILEMQLDVVDIVDVPSQDSSRLSPPKRVFVSVPWSEARPSSRFPGLKRGQNGGFA